MKLRISDVAQRLGVTDGTVRQWIRAGHLPAIQPARVFLIDELDLAQFERTKLVPTRAAA
jgi:excisionase family DNA binding protein